MSAHSAGNLPPTNVIASMPPVKPPRAPDTITIPTTPPRALLVSMAIRMRHDFGVDKAVGTWGCGFTAGEREVLIVEMAQLYEEVAGRGFYQWTKDANQRDGLYDL